jgi:hypothetical protein
MPIQYIDPRDVPEPAHVPEREPRAPDLDRRCAACGRQHGSVNVWLNCLSREVLSLRDAMRTAQEALHKT